MIDLEILAMGVQPKVHDDVTYITVELKDVDGRSLNEQADKILPCISSEELIKEIKYRGTFIGEPPDSEEVEELKDEIEVLKGALEEIQDVLDLL